MTGTSGVSGTGGKDGADEVWDEPMVVDSAGPEDLIATVWFRLGYRPRESLVLVGLERPRRRAGLIVRSDLPDLPPSGPALIEAVHDLLSTVLHSGAEAVFAMIAADAPLQGPRGPLTVAVLAAASRLSLPVVDVIGVTGTAFGSLLCPDQVCCPEAGRPLEAVMASRAAAGHVLLGQVVAESEEDLVAGLFPADGESAAVPRRRRPPHLLTARQRWLAWQRWTAACADAAAGRPPGPRSQTGRLSADMHDPFLRDAVLMHLLGDDEDKLSALVRDELSFDDSTVGDLDALLRRSPTGRPRHPGQAVAEAAVRAAAPGDRSPALAVLSLLAWWEGQGGRARLLVERARVDAPQVTLVQLVEDLLRLRVPPPWRWPAAGSVPARTG